MEQTRGITSLTAVPDPTAVLDLRGDLEQLQNLVVMAAGMARQLLRDSPGGELAVRLIDATQALHRAAIDLDEARTGN